MPFGGFAKNALIKIQNTLPKDRVRELRRFMGRILIAPADPLRALREIRLLTSELMAIEEAFTRRANVRIRYEDTSGSRTTRTIEPQALLVRFPTWYVLGYDSAKEGFWMFRADRIRSITLLIDEHFTLKPLGDVRSGCPSGVFLAKTS